MDGLNLTIGGRKLLLMTTADVVDAASGTTVGAWRSQSDEKDNKVRLTVDGGAESAIQAVYQFNGNNQLVVQLVGDDGTVFDPFTFVGGIEIDDQHDLQYVLVDNTGASTGKSITVYGELSFAENTNHLSIALTGGGIAEIQGLTGVQSLQAEKNHIAAFKADDLLIFHAETDNDIPGQDDLVVIPAKIDFVGAWDIQDGSLVFHSNIKGSPDSPAVSIGFAGTLEGSDRGIRVFRGQGADAGRPQYQGTARLQSGKSDHRAGVGDFHRVHRKIIPGASGRHQHDTSCHGAGAGHQGRSHTPAGRWDDAPNGSLARSQLLVRREQHPGVQGAASPAAINLPTT